MILQDSQIKLLLPTLFPDHHRALEIEGRVQPASVDLTIVGPLCRVTAPYGVALRPGRSELVPVGSWVLKPGMLYLIGTRERIVMPRDLVGRVDGRSSWGRVGLRIHATAGFIDPGFAGNITLELDIAGPPVELQEGDSICQVSFHALLGSAEKPYGTSSKYQDQVGVTASRNLEDGISK
jgi:dCTP deaminase